MTGNREQDNAEILQRILETVTWCKHKADTDHPQTCLRTPELKPTAYEAKTVYNFADHIPKYGQAQTLLADLDRKRHELIKHEQMSVEHSVVNRNNGRFMLYMLNFSEWSALSEDCSEGFFDEIDLPPWDTWISCLKTSWTDGMILSWVPAVFCERADYGMQCNPVDCIFWASEYRQRGYSSSVLEWLEDRGLLF